MSDYANLLFEVENEVGLITINRPKALNALNYDTLQELNQLFDQLAENQTVKTVIITGGGE